MAASSPISVPPIAGPEPFEIARPEGLVLRGEIHGPARGAPVVLLHGGGQSRSAWRGAARRLGEAGWRACAMDLRGHGRSDWSPAGNYTFADYAGDLAACIETLGPPAAVVGASLGGHIATVTAARRPDLVRALLLADVTPWIDESAGDHIRDTLRTSIGGFADVSEAARMVAQLSGEGSAGAIDVERLSRSMRVDEDGRLHWSWDTRFLDDSLLRMGGEGGLFQTAARAIRVPVLVMLAEHSNLTSPSEVEAFRAAVPQVRSVVIPGARHMVSGDVNDAYAASILAFLDSLPD